MPDVRSILDVLDRLDRVVADAVAARSRTAYFACLYRAVTRRVAEGIAAGRFEDGPRMERLDVCFARRYLAAHEAYRAGRPAPRSWTVAFDAAGSSRPLVLQHLLLGINAHIHYDLGAAAAEACPGPALAGLRRDFFAITALLGEMLDDVQGRLGRLSPWMGLLDLAGGRHDEALFLFGLGGSRDAAWRTAERLAALPAPQAAVELDLLDRTVAVLAGPVRNPPGRLGALVRLVRMRESDDVARVAAALA